MACSDSLIDCAVIHAARQLDLRCSQENRQWNGKCPGCGSPRALSLTIKQGRALWHCNRKPEGCSQAELMAALAIRLPGAHLCAPRGKSAIRRQPADILAQAEELVFDTGLSAATLRLRLAMVITGLSPKEAAAKLGYSRSTYYAAMGNLGRGNR